MARPYPREPSRSGRSAVAQAPDELQPRPGRVDRDDLHVDQAPGQPDLADDVLVQVARHAARPLRPGDPERAGGRQPRDERAEPALEPSPIRTERDDDV